MKKNVFEKLLDNYLDDAIMYGLTVLCVFLGGYILKGTHPETGFIPILSAMVSAVLLCLLVEVLTGTADTPEKKAAKKKAWPRRLLLSGLAGLASGSIIPVAIKAMFAPLGINL